MWVGGSAGLAANNPPRRPPPGGPSAMAWHQSVRAFSSTAALCMPGQQVRVGFGSRLFLITVCSGQPEVSDDAEAQTSQAQHAAGASSAASAPHPFLTRQPKGIHVPIVTMRSQAWDAAVNAWQRAGESTEPPPPRVATSGLPSPSPVPATGFAGTCCNVASFSVGALCKGTFVISTGAKEIRGFVFWIVHCWFSDICLPHLPDDGLCISTKRHHHRMAAAIC